MTEKMTVDREKMNRFLEAINSLCESAQNPYDSGGSEDSELDDELRDLAEDARFVKTQMEDLFHFDKPSWSWVEIKTREEIENEDH